MDARDTVLLSLRVAQNFVCFIAVLEVRAVNLAGDVVGVSAELGIFFDG